MKILAGDIGGTNTRLAIYENGERMKEKIYPSQEYHSLEMIVDEFLKEHKETVDRASFGVAGPVRKGMCQATNLPWVIDEAKIERDLKIHSVHLLNDLEAKAYGALTLKEDELLVLNPGDPSSTGNRALIAAGTGLGEAGLYWDGEKYHPFASEGGHVDFAPRNHLEVELLSYLLHRFGHASYERVVSGPGIHLLYQFLTETGRERSSLHVETAMKHGDPPVVIFDWATKHRDPACVRALEWFLSLYGAEAGNMALQFLSLGGFYIGGGIARSLVKEMQSGAFLTSFFNKGRFESLLKSMPIYVIKARNASLIGAAHYAEKMME